ncbi:hypothetical protein BLOT_001983 [Blomia tropicalis]|nr:hypothetical protein BLOT_001983 [Blomia tropicalis]
MQLGSWLNFNGRTIIFKVVIPISIGLMVKWYEWRWRKRNESIPIPTGNFDSFDYSQPLSQNCRLILTNTDDNTKNVITNECKQPSVTITTIEPTEETTKKPTEPEVKPLISFVSPPPSKPMTTIREKMIIDPTTNSNQRQSNGDQISLSETITNQSNISPRITMLKRPIDEEEELALRFVMFDHVRL